MHFPQLSLLFAFAASIAASPMAIEARAVTCAPAVVFGVRQTDTMQMTLGPNPRYNNYTTAMNDTMNAVVKKAGGNSYVQAIQYPAVNPTTGLYAQSVSMGVTALQNAVNNYTSACPAGQVFIVGYSQGSQVVSMAIGGATKLNRPKRLTAGVLFADPLAQDFFEPLDAGSGAADNMNGTAPGGAPIYQYLNSTFGKRIRSYCESGDRVCDSGSPTLGQTIHLNATEYFQTNATKFLLNKTT